MAYVPGYRHDLFVSYAHGDDREWISLFVARLQPALKQRLGVPAEVWIDDDSLRASRDFSGEIPDGVRSSAVFLLLASPTYIRSRYCVEEESRTFAATLPERLARFSAEGFARERFAFRCPIVPTDNNEHWSLFPGLTDIAFCDDSDTFAIGSAPFETSFRRLVGEIVGLLSRMRNHSTSVFLYPSMPSEDIAPAHAALAAELSAHSYRVLPDRQVNLAGQLRDASMAVFLLGAKYDEAADNLVDIASTGETPWVAWCAPSVEEHAGPEQAGFSLHVEQLDSPRKTWLQAGITAAKLKEEVLALLRPDQRALPEAQGKPRVYLVYNARDRADVKNAGLIMHHFRKEVHFDYPDDPAQHTVRLTRSDGVLLIWGSAEEEWCSREFSEMVQTSRRAGTQGLCVFDPQEAKRATVRAIRDGFRDVFVGEQYGRFDPAHLLPFFTPIVRRQEPQP